jgi:hypothetical protein
MLFLIEGGGVTSAKAVSAGGFSSSLADIIT